MKVKSRNIALILLTFSLFFISSFALYPKNVSAVCNSPFSVSLTPVPANPTPGQTLTLQIVGSGICDTYDLRQTQGPTNVIGGSSSVFVNSTGNQTNYTTSALSLGTYAFEVYGYDSGTGVYHYGDNTTVTVSNPSVDIKANGSDGPLSDVAVGSSIALSWTSNNVSSCSIDNGVGSVAVNGNTSRTINSTITYTITCQGSSTVSDSVTIRVAIQPVSVDIKAKDAFNVDQDGPVNIASGGSTAVTWTSVNATSCTATGGTASWPGSKATSGAQTTGAINSTTDFTITCVNSSGGSWVDTVQIVPQAYVGTAQTECVGTPPANPQINLSWSSSGYNRFMLYRAPISSASGSNYLTTLNNTTVYTDTAVPSGYGALHWYSVYYTNNLNQWGGDAVEMSSVATCDSTINVNITGNPPSTPTWTIQPENKSGSGNGSVAVRPSSSGSSYIFTPQSIPSCTLNISNSLGGGSSMTMTPGVSRTFTAKYSCSVLQAPICSLSASPTSVSSGQSSTLTWVSTNSTSASASASPANSSWIGSKAPVAGGSQTMTNLTQTTIFYLDVADGSGGTWQCQATVNVAGLPPSAPTGLTAVAGSCGSGTITLSWNASSGATSYNVLRGTTNGGPYSQIISGVTGTSHVDSGRTAGVTYYYVVQAVNGNGSSANSLQASATGPVATCAPSTPTGLTATPGACGTGSISLSWNASSGATSYELYRNGIQIYSGSGTTHPDTGLTAGNSYSYTVRATNGSGSSSQSGSVSATAPSLCPPAAPLGLSATPGACGTATINLSWSPSSGATSYNVLRSTTSGGPYSFISNVGGTSYPNVGLTPAVTYYYVVQAVNGSGTSGNSSSAAATAPSSCVAPAVSISASPTSGTVNVVNPNLTWSVANASPVPTCTASGDWSGSKVTSGTSVSQGVLSSVKTYTYTLSCTNTNGTGANTATVVVSPAPTASLGVTISGAPSATTWSVPAGSVNGSGGNGNYSYTVTPSSGGTLYTIIPGSITNYNSAVSNSQGGGSSMTLFGGNSETFTITYSATAAPFDFSLAATNPSVSVTAGSSVQNVINKTLLSGTTQSVTLTATGQPSGVTVSYANQGCSPTCSSTLTFSVPAGTTPGTYTINVSGTDGSITRNAAPFSLVINPPAVFSVACSANPITANVGQPVTWTATPSGGTGPYTYSWAGSDMPTAPAPSANPYVISYSTAGVKTGSVSATDTATSVTANCASQNVQVNVKPVFQEF